MRHFLIIVALLCHVLAYAQTKDEKVQTEIVMSDGSTKTLSLSSRLNKAISVLSRDRQNYLKQGLVQNAELLTFFEENSRFVSTWDYISKQLPNRGFNPQFLGLFVQANEYAKYGGNRVENYIYKENGNGNIDILTKDRNKHLATLWKGNTIEIDANDVNSWFAQLKPFPKCTYIINGAQYQTDANGRIEKAIFSLDSTSVGKHLRDQDVQANMHTLKGSNSKLYDAGHIVADRFGGSSNMVNLVPMTRKVNRSDYKRIENLWAKNIKQGKTVSAEVIIEYDTSSQIPSRFKVRYSYGNKVMEKIIENDIEEETSK